MDSVILFVLIVLMIFVGIMIYKNTVMPNGKSKTLKKEELEREYMAQLQEILSKCETKEEKVTQKKIYMHKLSAELSRNIFFTENEAKQLLQKLAVL